MIHCIRIILIIMSRIMVMDDQMQSVVVQTFESGLKIDVIVVQNIFD